MRALLTKIKLVTDTIYSIEKKMKVIEKKAEENDPIPDLSITISKYVHNGTRISINALVWECKDSLKGSFIACTKDGETITVEKG